jgi:ABC-type phosphate/phosphonate transport system permease subunit
MSFTRANGKYHLLVNYFFAVFLATFFTAFFGAAFLATFFTAFLATFFGAVFLTALSLRYLFTATVFFAVGIIVMRVLVNKIRPQDLLVFKELIDEKIFAYYYYHV